GQSLGYRDGSDAKTVWIRARWDDAARQLTLEPDARMKKWPGGTRVFAVEVAGGGAAIGIQGRAGPNQPMSKAWRVAFALWSAAIASALSAPGDVVFKNGNIY